MRGEKDDFFKFYLDTYLVALRYVSGMGEIHEIAEDVVQEIYCIAYENWDRLCIRDMDSRRGWLFKAANYILYNLHRRKDNTTISIELIGDMTEGMSVCADFESAEWKLVAQKMFSEKDRKLFEQYYILNYGIAEIAGELKTSEESVRMRLSRIRKKMRSKFAR